MGDNNIQKHRTQNTKHRISTMNLQSIEKIMKFPYRELNHPPHPPRHFASLPNAM
jgi:hypothetical protein